MAPESLISSGVIRVTILALLEKKSTQREKKCRKQITGTQQLSD